MSAPKKYEFKNGVLVRIPDAGSAAASATVTTSSTSTKPGAVPSTATPIAMVCSVEDLAIATEVAAAHGVASAATPATQAAIEGFHNPDFVKLYKAPESTSGESILEHLGSVFSSLEIPLGVLSKLLVLSNYHLNFIIDDSASMISNTDSNKYQAGPYMLKKFKSANINVDSPMARWEEVEDRLHTMMEILAYVPTGIITISFLNKKDIINLDRTGQDPATFLQICHAEIEKQFIAHFGGGTPIYAKLDSAFKSSEGLTMHYLLTDGEPSDARPRKVADLVLRRPNPIQNPVTFISCTNDDAATEWMKDIDEKGPMLAEVDDFNDEKDEVRKKQGPALPYTRGLWLMSLLVGAINPDDLDCLDDANPISKYTLDNLMGRFFTEQEYSQYFTNHPKGSFYKSKFFSFANEKKTTREILNLSAPGEQAKRKSFFGWF